ncbi:MAG: DUF2953 domain-containing protein [Oscillospiraceae bacterium]
MTALLIILAIIVFILVVPLGVRVAYLNDVLHLAARVLCFNIRLLPKREKPDKPPKKKKEKKPKKPKKPKKSKKEDEAEAEEPKKKPSPSELIDLAKLGLGALSRFRRKLTVNSFMLHFTAADDDPYDAAMLYAFSNTVLGILLPLAEESFNIRKSDVKTAVSFETTEPSVDAELTLTISLGRILGIGIALGFAFLKQKIKKQRETSRAVVAEERTDKDGTADAAKPDGRDDAGQHGEDKGDGGC